MTRIGVIGAAVAAGVWSTSTAAMGASPEHSTCAAAVVATLVSRQCSVQEAVMVFAPEAARYEWQAMCAILAASLELRKAIELRLGIKHSSVDEYWAARRESARKVGAAKTDVHGDSAEVVVDGETRIPCRRIGKRWFRVAHVATQPGRTKMEMTERQSQSVTAAVSSIQQRLLSKIASGALRSVAEVDAAFSGEVADALSVALQH